MEEILAAIRRIIAEDNGQTVGWTAEQTSSDDAADEQTMEEMPTSIRRIIAEDGASEEAPTGIDVAGDSKSRRRDISQEAELNASPNVPPPRLAAIEPEWIDGRLTLRRESARADLPADQVTSLFIVLRRELVAFAGELAKGNHDPRFLAYIQRLISNLPEATPDQVAVFELGHASGRLEAYAGTFAEETTSIFLQEQYLGLIELLRQVTAQFPAWRDFKRNAFASELSQRQITAGFTLATELAAAMETEEAQDFIDPALPIAIRELVSQPQSPSRLDGPGTDLQAADAVASSGNTLRSLALASAAKLAKFKDMAGHGAVKGIEKISENVVVYTASLVYVGAIGGLISLFPQLGWIMPFVLATLLSKKTE